METKKWYESKTLWVNAIAALALLAQYFSGKEIIDAEAQAAILVIVNVILRIVTNKGLE